MKPGSKIHHPIFKQRARYGLRVCFYLLCSVFLLIADHESAFFHRFREKIAIIDMPFYYGVDFPVRGIAHLVSNVTTREDLLKANARLQTENALLEAKVQKLLSVESDNSALLALLESSGSVRDKVLEAEIIAVATDPFQHQVIVNKGSIAHTFVGQAALDARGVIGQIVQVEPLVSRVMLITDTDSEVPVQNHRNGIRAIALGDAENSLLSLQDVPQTADFKVGDLLITSGLGGHYPFGYPVARIISVVMDPDDQFSQIKARPLARLDRTRLVLLVWPRQQKAIQEAKAALSTISGGLHVQQ